MRSGYVENRQIVCFTVPNEILITRRLGKVAVQGNTKHALHLVRLLTMCKEILSTGKVIVKRPDAEFLLSIRNGAWDYNKLISWAEQQEKEIMAIKSDLPYAPDIKKLDELCVELVESML